MTRLLTKHWIAVILGLWLFNTAPASSEDNWPYGEFRESTYLLDQSIVIISWDTPSGRERLQRSKYNYDYFQLAHNFQPQLNPLYCGIASSVIVLNSMRLTKGSIPNQKAIEINRPKALGGGLLNYPSYSQLTLLGDKTDPVKPRAIIELKNIHAPKNKLDPGLTLKQLSGILKAYGASVQIHYADKSPLDGPDTFRHKLKNILRDSTHFIIVNFHGKSMGAPTDGHITPIGAYDEKTDSVLLLDVAGYLNPWYWVPVEHLYWAMHTKDGENYRGYVIVSDN